MLFLNRKEQQVREKLRAYLSLVLTCNDTFKNLCKTFLRAPTAENLDDLVSEITPLESRADSLRREIEYMLYAKMLLPESRGDILGLIENMDRIPNKMESFAIITKCQRITPVAFLTEHAVAILDITADCVKRLINLILDLYFGHGGDLERINEIFVLEGEVDSLQVLTITSIFASDLSDLDKILLRDWVNHLCSISNIAENLADRLKIITIKHNI